MIVLLCHALSTFGSYRLFQVGIGMTWYPRLNAFKGLVARGRYNMVIIERDASYGMTLYSNAVEGLATKSRL